MNKPKQNFITDKSGFDRNQSCYQILTVSHPSPEAGGLFENLARSPLAAGKKRVAEGNSPSKNLAFNSQLS